MNPTPSDPPQIPDHSRRHNINPRDKTGQPARSVRSRGALEVQAGGGRRRRPRRGARGRRTHPVELEDVGAEADAVALVDADVARHPAERGPAAARERHVPRLLAELHQAPALAGLGEPQAEVGREVEAGAERPHHLVHHFHHCCTDTRLLSLLFYSPLLFFYLR